MVSVLNIAIALLWFASALVDYAEFCYLWQLKEYRWDRFRDFLSTKQGKAYWLRYPLLLRSFLALIIYFWPINDPSTIKWFIILLFTFDLVKNSLRVLLKKTLRYPKPTKKALSLILFVMGLEAALFISTRDWTVLLLLSIVRFPLFSLLVGLSCYPTRWVKRYFIHQAKVKLASYPSLIVIGITGSFGKTSVKECLAHILSVKFKVVKTPLHVNTEIGVANFIRQTDFRKVEIFIVEMGAYQVGEIGLICDMVRPRLGVLTAINEQHLSLFGNLKKIQQSKYELLRYLPANGLAVANSDNPYCREFLPELSCQAQTFGAEEKPQPTCVVAKVKADLAGVDARCVIGGEPWDIHTPLLGEHVVMNIAPCLLVAQYLGLPKEIIIERCQTLEPPPETLRLHHWGNCLVIDDSYNSNPTGFISALSLFELFPGEKKRIVITRGMLELGESSDALHEKIGENLALMADEVVLITNDFVQPIKRGIGEKYPTKLLVKDNSKALLDYVKLWRDKEAVILLENRIPIEVYKELIPIS